METMRSSTASPGLMFPNGSTLCFSPIEKTEVEDLNFNQHFRVNVLVFT
jgi:hypothetical protein